MPVIARRRVVRPRAYRLAVSISKGDRFLSFTGVCRATLARSARQPGRWISMGYAKYFVFPITSTSLTHCTPGITIVYTTVHAIGLPGGWHRESETVTTFAATLEYFSSIFFLFSKRNKQKPLTIQEEIHRFLSRVKIKFSIPMINLNRSNSLKKNFRKFNLNDSRLESKPQLLKNRIERNTSKVRTRNPWSLTNDPSNGKRREKEKKKRDRSRSIDLSAKTRTGCDAPKRARTTRVRGSRSRAKIGSPVGLGQLHPRRNRGCPLRGLTLGALR